jgi:hypothetical protein
MLNHVKSYGHKPLSKFCISRRAFTVGGAGFLGGAAVLLYGCEKAINNPAVGNINGSDNKMPQPPQGALREVTLEERLAEIEIASGRRVKTWTNDGKFPSMEIRSRERLFKYV